MTNVVEQRLTELGISLPEPIAPVANYVPYVVSGNLIFVSGQVPLADGKVQMTGLVGAGLTVEQGQEAARLCAVNLIAQAKAACGGDLARISRVVKLTGFVACPADFTDHPNVVNGASDIMVEVFGEVGKHARAAVGMSSLPLGVPVEVEAIFEMA